MATKRSAPDEGGLDGVEAIGHLAEPDHVGAQAARACRRRRSGRDGEVGPAVGDGAACAQRDFSSSPCMWWTAGEPRAFVQVVDVLGAEEQIDAGGEAGEGLVRRVRGGCEQVPAAGVVEGVHGDRVAAKASGVASFIGSNLAQMPPASRKVPRPLSAETPAPVRTKIFSGGLPSG